MASTLKRRIKRCYISCAWGIRRRKRSLIAGRPQFAKNRLRQFRQAEFLAGRTSRAKVRLCSVRPLERPAFAQPPQFQAREENQNPKSSIRNPIRCEPPSVGVRQPQSGLRPPLGARLHTAIMPAKKHHCRLIAIMFFQRERPASIAVPAVGTRQSGAGLRAPLGRLVVACFYDGINRVIATPVTGSESTSESFRIGSYIGPF